ncbi:MAG: hypothetical protein NZ853_01520 [Leptospiraceae bacterium]|nr:hypothetical protein [Leptospiraceae bacterium]MDW7976093.1 hypothetical protein [Leptospiraceae bacterium]
MILNVISPKDHDFIWKLDEGDIILIVKNGNPLYGIKDFEKLFQFLNVPYEEVKVKQSVRIIKKGFTKKMQEIFYKLNKKVNFHFLPIEI